MRLIWIYCLCLLMIVFVHSHLRNFLSIEPLISQIKARQVVFLNQDDHQKQQIYNNSLNKMENWIYSRFASILPSAWIDIDKDSARESLQKSNSLFLYVGVEDDIIDVNFIKNLKSLTLNFPPPIRILLIMFGHKNDSSVRYLELLKLFWQEQLVDVTIIGISSKASKNRHKISIVNHETDYATMIHHYNPFTSVYTNRSFDFSSRLFPAKLDDLHGHKLRVGFFNDPPLSWLNQESQKITGFVSLLLETIQSKMNFSVQPDFLTDYPLDVDSYTRLLLQIVSKRRLDVFATGAHILRSEHYHHRYPLDRSTFITFERICGLVPLLKKTVLQLSRSIQWSLLLILSLVAIVWLSSLLLLRRDDASSLLLYWRPLDIALMMMGASIPARAMTLRERILFGCVLVVGLFYSSMILAHLTSMNLDFKAHVRFETHRELDESGLKPFINPYAFNVTFGYSVDPSLRSLGEKAFLSPERDTCFEWLLVHANVSCILIQSVNPYLLALHGSRVKQAEPCYWSAYRALIASRGSPYTPSFDRIIRATQESGIVQKYWRLLHVDAVVLHNKRISVEASSGFAETSVVPQRDKSYRTVFFLLFTSYVLSLGVFLMELIVKHFCVKLKRQRRQRRRGCVNGDQQ